MESAVAVLDRYDSQVLRIATQIRPAATAIDWRAQDRSDYVSLLQTKVLHAHRRYDDYRARGGNEDGFVWVALRNLAASAIRAPRHVQFVPLDEAGAEWEVDDRDFEREMEAREQVEVLRELLSPGDMEILEAWSATGTARGAWRLLGCPGNPRKFPEIVRGVVDRARLVLGELVTGGGDEDDARATGSGSGSPWDSLYERHDGCGAEADGGGEEGGVGRVGSDRSERGATGVLRAHVGSGVGGRQLRGLQSREALSGEAGVSDDLGAGGHVWATPVTRRPNVRIAGARGVATGGDRDATAEAPERFAAASGGAGDAGGTGAAGGSGSGAGSGSDGKSDRRRSSRGRRAGPDRSAGGGAGGEVCKEGTPEKGVDQGSEGAREEAERQSVAPRGGNGDGRGDGGPSEGRTCVACGGSGLSSRGRVCHPCRGTGVREAAEKKDWGRWEGKGGEQESRAEENQLDLLTDTQGQRPGGGVEASEASEAREALPAQEESGGGAQEPGRGPVGRAHVPVEVGAGASPVANDRADSEAGKQARTPVQRVAVRSLVPGRILPDGWPEVSDAVQCGARDHRRDDVPGDLRGREAPGGQDQGDDELVSDEVLRAPTPDVTAGIGGKSGGWISNLTTHQITGPHDWGSYEPVLVTPEGYHVYQFDYWSAALGKWVWVVRAPTGRQVPEGVVEITLEQQLGLATKGGSVGSSYAVVIDHTGKGTTQEIPDWTGFPPICTTRFGDRVFQVTFWSKHLQCWVVLVAKRTGRPAAPGSIELELDDVFRIQRHLAAGCDVQTAVMKVQSGVAN